MKTINQYIQEKFIITKDIKIKYNYFPKTKEELRKILEERLTEDKNADLNDIDVSKITDMGLNDSVTGLFEDLDPHNIDITKWNVSKVTNMEYIFFECKNFNCDLSNWKVDEVKNMKYMFYGCKNFTGKGLEKWKVDEVKDMKYMFDGCSNFNSNLSQWNVNSIINMECMFNNCLKLKNKPSWYTG